MVGLWKGETNLHTCMDPHEKRKIRWRKKAKRLSSSNIVTESFGPEGKRRHERLALLLQA